MDDHDRERAEAAHMAAVEDQHVAAREGAGTATYLAADAAYWRGETRRLKKRLREIQEAAGRGEYEGGGTDGPPEPPLDTQFYGAGGLVWQRYDSGWRCPRRGCPNCPADWPEVAECVESLVRRLPGEDMPVASPAAPLTFPIEDEVPF